jgi:hypothetical protein
MDRALGDGVVDRPLTRSDAAGRDRSWASIAARLAPGAAPSLLAKGSMRSSLMPIGRITSSAYRWTDSWTIRAVSENPAPPPADPVCGSKHGSFPWLGDHRQHSFCTASRSLRRAPCRWLQQAEFSAAQAS